MVKNISAFDPDVSFPRVAAARKPVLSLPKEIPNERALHEMWARRMDASGFLAQGSEMTIESFGGGYDTHAQRPRPSFRPLRLCSGRAPGEIPRRSCTRPRVVQRPTVEHGIPRAAATRGNDSGGPRGVITAQRPSSRPDTRPTLVVPLPVREGDKGLGRFFADRIKLIRGTGIPRQT